MSMLENNRKVAARDGDEWFAGTYKGVWFDFDETSGKVILKHKVARGNREYICVVVDEVVPIEDYDGPLSHSAYYDDAVPYNG